MKFKKKANGKLFNNIFEVPNYKSILSQNETTSAFDVCKDQSNLNERPEIDVDEDTYNPLITRLPRVRKTPS